MRFSLDLAGSMLILSLFTTSSLARPSHGALKHEHHHHPRGDVAVSSEAAQPSLLARNHGNGFTIRTHFVTVIVTVPATGLASQTTTAITTTSGANVASITSSVLAAAASISSTSSSSSSKSSRTSSHTSSSSSTSTSSFKSSSSSKSSFTTSSPSSTSTSSSRSSSLSSVATSGAYSGSCTVSLSTTYAKCTASTCAIVTPTPIGSSQLDRSELHPDLSYVPQSNIPYTTLDPSLLNPVSTATPKDALAVGYPMYPNSGTLIVDENTPLNATKSATSYVGGLVIGRDNGKGGNICGNKIFLFADSYVTQPDGSFGGFVSNSVAVDKGMGPKTGDPIMLNDKIGGWADDSFLLRGFVPFTTAEASYNYNSHGHRFAVWPETGLIPYNSDSALVYAPVEYIDMSVVPATFSYTGATLMEITVPGIGGPHAERIAPMLFDAGQSPELEWGTIGGLRSWGQSGPGGKDGSVYIFGNPQRGGLYLARTDYASVADSSSYKYWDGSKWTSTMLDRSSTAYFLKGMFGSADVFYSPRHLTFIAVTLTFSNVFNFQYLMATEPILPSYAGGSESDIVENLVKYQWSTAQTLYTTPTPEAFVAYTGGPHLGYFDEDDITNGGSKMLLTWTAKTLNGENGGYNHMSAVITWD